MLRKNRSTEIAQKTDERATRPAAILPATSWFEDMDRWFDDVRRQFERTWSAPYLATGLTSVRHPAVDLRDMGTEIVVTAEMPGAAKEDIEVATTPTGLEIRAEVESGREQRDEGYVYRERNVRSFHRALDLPAEVVPDKAVATLQNGILEVRLPKREPTPETKPVTVTVE